MHIAPKIIRKCIEPAMSCHDMPREPKASSRPETPSSAGVTAWTPANARPKGLKTFGSESGYGTDTDRSDTYLCSPKKPRRSGLKALVAPRSRGVHRRYKPCYAPSSTPSSLYGEESDLSDDGKKRKHHGGENSSSDSAGSYVASAKKRKASSATPVMTAESAAKHLLDLCLQDARLAQETSNEKVDPTVAGAWDDPMLGYHGLRKGRGMRRRRASA